METGKSTATHCCSKYPLKFIIPNKVGPSQTEAVWIYTITYGGGIMSGDSIKCDISVGDGCTTVLTTQASTKVYKSVESKCSEQVPEARIGSDALLAVIPDPVTCFSTAKYSQTQVFKVFPSSSLLIVDWITSGRYGRGEKWDFELYKSTNNIFLEADEPLFLDTILLEQGRYSSIAERMQDYQVIAMVILLGPKMKFIQDQIQENVKNLMSQQFRIPSGSSERYGDIDDNPFLTRPSFLASCSVFGQKGRGVVVRIATMTVESVYSFLQCQLSGRLTAWCATISVIVEGLFVAYEHHKVIQDAEKANCSVCIFFFPNKIVLIKW